MGGLCCLLAHRRRFPREQGCRRARRLTPPRIRPRQSRRNQRQTGLNAHVAPGDNAECEAASELMMQRGSKHLFATISSAVAPNAAALNKQHISTIAHAATSRGRTVVAHEGASSVGRRNSENAAAARDDRRRERQRARDVWKEIDEFEAGRDLTAG